MIELTEKQQAIIAPSLQRVAEARGQLVQAEQHAYDLITLAFPDWNPEVHSYQNGQITERPAPQTDSVTTPHPEQ